MNLLLALALFTGWATSTVSSPFSPNALHDSTRQAFFEGWFFRIADHEHQVSVVLIFASYREAGAKRKGLKHYVSLGLSRKSNGNGAREVIKTFHAFRDDKDGGPIDRPTSKNDRTSSPEFTWAAQGIGSVTVSGDEGYLQMALPELSIFAKFSGRVPWSTKRPNGAGPEGWLGATDLLPLRYFIHSFASDANYTVTPSGEPPMMGRGSMHLETNYGRAFFPKGWVWAQGVDTTTECESGVKFVMTGGKFLIGPLTTNSFLIGYRSALHTWDFRNTDLDRIQASWSVSDGQMEVIARSPMGGRVLEARLYSAERSFGDQFYVPGDNGWTNQPGAMESHNVTAKFRLYKRKAPYLSRQLVEEAEVTMAVLEFGGEFINPQ
ncbi:unnamed protein product [Discosporangium mesarthrocarpum]